LAGAYVGVYDEASPHVALSAGWPAWAAPCIESGQPRQAALLAVVERHPVRPGRPVWHGRPGTEHLLVLQDEQVRLCRDFTARVRSLFNTHTAA
jgi:hypothetical protein